MKPHIGVFWVCDKTVLGRAIPLEEGEDSFAERLDSPDNHVDLWENNPALLKSFPHLQDKEYFSIPRGRVLWDKRNQKAIVYMDKVLFSLLEGGLGNIQVVSPEFIEFRTFTIILDAPDDVIAHRCYFYGFEMACLEIVFGKQDAHIEIRA